MKETKIVCPKCGAEFAIPEHEHVACGTVIGKDSGLGIIHPTVVGQTDINNEQNVNNSHNTNSKNSKVMNNAENMIEQLKAAGIDTKDYFAMSGGGNSYVARMNEGKLEVVADNDPVFDIIRNGGQIPNKDLFRRWVTGQMFDILTAKTYQGKSINPTEAIRKKGYDYTMKMVKNELFAQFKIHTSGDEKRYEERNMWFNRLTCAEIAKHDLEKLKEVIENAIIRHHKDVEYKRICGQDVYVHEIQEKIIRPMESCIAKIYYAWTPGKLFDAWCKFMEVRIRLYNWNTEMSPVWMNSYKGAGAFFTMQNLIRFSGMKLMDENNVMLSKEDSEAYLNDKAGEYRTEGWKLLGMLREALVYNNIDIAQKKEFWRKQKQLRKKNK